MQYIHLVKCTQIELVNQWRKFTFSGLGGGQSLLNFRQNFQISDTPPPTPLLGQNFRKFVIFREGGGGGSPLRPTEISATVVNMLYSVHSNWFHYWVL
jgi:hypothetical protein